MPIENEKDQVNIPPKYDFFDPEDKKKNREKEEIPRKYEFIEVKYRGEFGEKIEKDGKYYQTYGLDWPLYLTALVVLIVLTLNKAKNRHLKGG